MPQLNGVAFQFFHWYLDKDDSFQKNKSLWDFLKEEADNLRQIGIDAVWIPPAYRTHLGSIQTARRLSMSRIKQRLSLAVA